MYDLIKDQARDARGSRSSDYERITRHLVEQVRGLRDRLEDDYYKSKEDINNQDILEHKKALKLAEKELSFYSNLLEKTNAAKIQSEVRYKE